MSWDADVDHRDGQQKRALSRPPPLPCARAAELALLLTDAPIEVVEDWLDGRMEHQVSRSTAHAGPEDLDRLYRGHCAAIVVVSLSARRIGVRVRPEILVYEAMCGSEGVAHRDDERSTEGAVDVDAKPLAVF